MGRPSPDRPTYGLLWWTFDWATHRVLVARGSDGHLIVVSPEQRAVIAITGTNVYDAAIEDEALFPLVNEVILPALD